LSDHLDYLTAVVEAQPDITMPELGARLLADRGVKAHEASIADSEVIAPSIPR
jgi:hypothetical protein